MKKHTKAREKGHSTNKDKSVGKLTVGIDLGDKLSRACLTKTARLLRRVVSGRQMAPSGSGSRRCHQPVSQSKLVLTRLG